jgi:hypothetical protein
MVIKYTAKKNYIRRKYHMLSFNGSFVIAVNLEAKTDFARQPRPFFNLRNKIA